MLKIIKTTLIIVAILSGVILAVLFLQDRTKKLEDRNYDDINKIIIESDTSNVNIYKSKNKDVRVVVYGSSKDNVKLIEGTKYLTVSKESKKKNCILNCKNEINIYVPDNFEIINIKSETGNINTESVTIKNLSIESETGNINIDKVNLLNVNNKIGNININTIDAINNCSIKTETGNITIEKIINLKIDSKSETGSVVIPVIKEEQKFTLKLETKVGNIDIKHHENKSE